MIIPRGRHRLYADWQSRGQLFISAVGHIWRDGHTLIGGESRHIELGDYWSPDE